MKIKESGELWTLYRYSGLDSSKKSTGAKIGSVHCDVSKEVSLEGGPEVKGRIPYTLWEDLTIKEQRELVARIDARTAEKLAAGLDRLIDDLVLATDSIRPNSLDLLRAEKMLTAVSGFSTALRKSGYQKRSRILTSDSPDIAAIVV